jgi:hypothetical protein
MLDVECCCLLFVVVVVVVGCWLLFVCFSHNTPGNDLPLSIIIVGIGAADFSKMDVRGIVVFHCFSLFLRLFLIVFVAVFIVFDVLLLSHCFVDSLLFCFIVVPLFYSLFSHTVSLFSHCFIHCFTLIPGARC